MKLDIKKYLKKIKLDMKRLVHKNENGYCGKCRVCKKLSDDIVEDTKDLPKIYRVLYDEDVCFKTLNKLARDKRYRNNIRIESIYPEMKRLRVDAPTDPQDEKELDEAEN